VGTSSFAVIVHTIASEADPGVVVGGKVERRRREPSQGAEAAKRDGAWRGGVSLSTGGKVWGGGSAVSAEIFKKILGSKWRIFVDSWC